MAHSAPLGMTFLARSKLLAGGFQNADGSFWGRPVDAAPGPDGALHVAGAIYRLAPPH